MECTADSDFDLEQHICICVDVLSNALAIVLDVGLEECLQPFKEDVPNLKDRATFEFWWQVNHLD